MRSLSAILLFVLLSISTFAQEQWYFFVDERYPAESSLLKDKQRILVVKNALTQLTKTAQIKFNSMTGRKIKMA